MLKQQEDEAVVNPAASSLPTEETDPVVRKLRRAAALANSGFLGRATKCLLQGSLASVDEKVIEQLRELHPAATEKAPPLPVDTVPVIDVDIVTLRKLIDKKLKNGSAGGPSGWTGELIGALIGDSECEQALAVLIRDLINGSLNDKARSYLMASLLIPLAKEGGGVRPIAISESFYKLATMYVMSGVKKELGQILEPLQLGVGAKGGPERAVHLVQAGLESMGPQAILLKTDMKNAFNSRRRDQMLSVLFQHDSLKPIWRLAHWAYKDSSDLLVFDKGVYKATIPSSAGVKQGDTFGSPLFALSIHDKYVKCSNDSDEVVKAAITDDFNVVGPFMPVLQTFDRFEGSLKDTGLEIRRNKCGILWPHKEPIPEQLAKEAQARDIKIETGAMATLGAMVGFDMDKISAWVGQKLQKHEKLFELLRRDELPAQIACLLLRLCAVPCMGYLLRVTPPPILRDHARLFDAQVIETAARRLGLPMPLSEQATQLLQLPVRMGGFGFRSAVRTAPAAYYSAVARTAPDIKAIIPELKQQAMLVDEKSRIGTSAQISACLDYFQQEELPVGEDALPADVEAFWASGGGVPDDVRLQSVLSGLLDEKVVEKMKNKMSRAEQQRLTSSASKYAATWLTTIPSSHNLKLSDSHMGIAARLRLGLPVKDNLPDLCSCGKTFGTDLSHFLCCRLLAGYITKRHHAIVKRLAGYFSKAGALVSIEQRIPDTVRSIPDLEIVSTNHFLLVDVVITTPSAPSHRSLEPLAAADRSEGKKVSSYGQLADARGAKCYGFALESFGAWGKQAVAVLKALGDMKNSSTTMSVVTPRESKLRVVQEIAIALQSWNAKICEMGVLKTLDVERLRLRGSEGEEIVLGAIVVETA